MRAFGFDLGETLINYHTPLNWKAHYRDGLREIGKRYTQDLAETQLQKGELCVRLDRRLMALTLDLVVEITYLWFQPNPR